MKNIKLKVKERKCERCIVTMTAENSLGVLVSRDLDFSGNAIGVLYYGAHLVVDALNEMETAT
jgi:hypothetical protein